MTNILKMNDYVKVKESSLNKNQVGKIIESYNRNGIQFIMIRTTRNKTILGSCDAFIKIDPSKNDKEKIRLYEKLRLLK